MKSFLALCLILSKVPLSGFQFLLLICLIEIETGIYVGDLYYFILLFFYLTWNYLWKSALKGGRVKWE